jgi:hypothetical protein
MFSVFTDRLRVEIGTVKAALETHDRFRALVFSTPITPEEIGEDTPASGEPSGAAIATAEPNPRDPCEEELDEIRAKAPSKSSWQVYDHCAAFTRLYAVYEQFIEELISDYLRILPELHEKYEDLPESITKQHRIGTGQILLKLGKDGPFRHLNEKQIVADLSQALVGGANYKLLRDAFLIDPQNYRTEVLGKLFAYLGIDNCWAWVERHPLVIEFMDHRRDRTETPATVLNSFVAYRNDAAHTRVTETVATEEVKSIADCVMVICEALAQLVMKHVIRRREQLGQVTVAGQIIHRFSDCIVGARMRGGTVAVGDEMVIVQKHSCYEVGVRSIQIGETPYDRLNVIDGQEIGLQLTVGVRQGAWLLRIPAPILGVPQEQQPELLSPDEFPSTQPEEIEPESEPH